jgi:hypothetical protein
MWTPTEGCPSVLMALLEELLLLEDGVSWRLIGRASSSASGVAVRLRFLLSVPELGGGIGDGRCVYRLIHRLFW